MRSLKQILAPLLKGEGQLSDLSQHESEAFQLFCHFRALDVVQSDDPKAELERIPYQFRKVVRDKAIQLYKSRVLDQ